MKKSILCVSFFLFLGFCSSAQTWLWGAQGYTVQDVEGWPVAADNNGNAFLAGYYRDSIAFGAYSLTTTTSNVNCYLAKYDSSGNVQWAKQANSTSAFCMNTAVAADLFGNSYISGQFNGIISFDTDTLTTAPGQYDYFFVKYDIKGNVLWAQQASAAQGNSIASDNSGNIYVTGQFSGTPTFGNTTLNNNTNGDAFIVKYNTKGSAVWAKQSFSGTVSGSVVGNSVAVDVQRNVFITGSFHNTISFGTYVLTGTSQYNVFIVKYDSSGNVLWAEQSSSGNVSNNYVGYSIVADSYDDSYITGIFQGQISFGNYNLNSPNGDAFLVKYDPNGKVIWAKQSSGGVAGYSLAIDKFNNLYFSGGTDSLVTFCNHTFSIKSSYISDASLLMKIDTGGNALCGIISAGGGGDDRNGIACSPDGECIYFGGDIADTITFGSDFLSDPGGETPFIARWEPCGRQIDTNENIITGTCTNIFVPDAFSPNKDGYNDVLYVRSDCIKTIDFILFDRWGEKIFETTSLNYGWDGTYKGQPMNTGSFVYYLKAQLYNGTSIEKKGSVALVR